MLKTLANAWKVEDLRKKMLFTLMIVAIFRFGNVLPLPFINPSVVKQIYAGQAGSLLSILNSVTGGSLDSLSAFALGVGPYITSSIVVQLLTFAIPSLEEISKQGEQGRKQIQRITKYLALGLALLQAYGIVIGIFSSVFTAEGFLPKLIVITALVAGTQFVVWLGELITEHGIGNGISMIIFLGIISRLPNTIITWGKGVINGAPGFEWWKALILIAILLLSVVFVVYLTQGERRIPVQYAKRVVGRKMYGGSSTHIPIKVNMSGVMPVIFASSLLALPQTLALVIGGGFRDFVQKYLSTNSTISVIVFVIVQFALVILFAYFYNSIQFNPYEYSKNLQQNGGFIPGIRPGKPTTEYLGRIVSRITMIGAIGLGIIAAAPRLFGHFMSVNLLLGGTSIIIVVGVIIETVNQLEAMMQMRHYKGFLNK
ncbi:preprotein translocase subunit SecY [Helcococcus kunzii]|uniref:Protein translocase subunit SecY n=1 Tax=Helcococcus kunzii ATCC 51366 TaxID=883114 RepID=H3NP48_9FIRM|nr:preprotein translocase subunit SecY [Helcococcus kunzii]EHR33510.1 preprotein translocase, SecY subunit [Helcococcus kunzii ATCC 51366]MCT1795772.1 preprotein translocase subunit SecY [Helcococcus kunzii]MCT1989351.1 preprotein translocase subunit SecY [Helcococcus kunzii]QUY65014.1 preprotein translocase subunit SecY [Helcococcus kunzii]QZO75721.1 preprotein translocase subunit SecY [Helcococcus kunzii]